MSRKLIVTKQAEADILDSYLSYGEKQEGLGLRFMDENGPHSEATQDSTISPSTRKMRA